MVAPLLCVDTVPVLPPAYDSCLRVRVRSIPLLAMPGDEGDEDGPSTQAASRGRGRPRRGAQRVNACAWHVTRVL